MQTGLRTTSGWQTKGLWKGHFGIRGFFEWIDFSIRSWVEGIGVEQKISKAVVRTETTKTITQFSTISFDSAKKVITKSRRNFWRVVISLRVFLDLVWNIPWKKIVKVLILLAVVPTVLIGSGLAIKFEIDKDQMLREDMETFRLKYKADMEEVYTLNNAKLEQLENRMSELEQKAFLYEHRIPVIVKQPRPFTATIMTGKNRGQKLEVKQ